MKSKYKYKYRRSNYQCKYKVQSHKTLAYNLEHFTKVLGFTEMHRVKVKHTQQLVLDSTYGTTHSLIYTIPRSLTDVPLLVNGNWLTQNGLWHGDKYIVSSTSTSTSTLVSSTSTSTSTSPSRTSRPTSTSTWKSVLNFV